MHPIYEYIVSILIISMILGFSFYTINTTTESQLSLGEEEQLNTISNNIFEKIFLSPGNPSDWGSDIFINDSNLGGFGLSDANSGNFYLDANKILRLYEESGNTTNPLYIDPKAVGKLLGIYKDNYWTYGFSIKIVSALNISIVPIEFFGNIPTYFHISIVDYMGRPATNAHIKGALLVVNLVGQGNNRQFEFIKLVSENYSNIRGYTELNFQLPQNISPQATYLFIVNAEYYGMHSQNIYSGENVLNVVMIGDYLIINMSGISGFVPSARHLRIAAIEITSSLNIILNPVVEINETTDSESWRIINKGHYNYRIFKLSNPVSEDVMFVGLLVFAGAREGARYFIVFAERPRTPLSLFYSSHGYRFSGFKTEVIGGLFIIGGNTYYVELAVWRMSE